eukprot:gene2820-biopygen4322
MITLLDSPHDFDLRHSTRTRRIARQAAANEHRLRATVAETIHRHAVAEPDSVLHFHTKIPHQLLLPQSAWAAMHSARERPPEGSTPGGDTWSPPREQMGGGGA